MESKHAVEQWEIHDSGDRHPEIHPAGDTDGLFIIADVIQRDKAPLIAAAPDLLASLKELVAEFDAMNADRDPAREGQFLDTGGMGMARAAIAKAKGEYHGK